MLEGFLGRACLMHCFTFILVHADRQVQDPTAIVAVLEPGTSAGRLHWRSQTGLLTRCMEDQPWH
jgi:hypothetical protein